MLKSDWSIPSPNHSVFETLANIDSICITKQKNILLACEQALVWVVGARCETRVAKPRGRGARWAGLGEERVRVRVRHLAHITQTRACSQANILRAPLTQKRKLLNRAKTKLIQDKMVAIISYVYCFGKCRRNV